MELHALVDLRCIFVQKLFRHLHSVAEELEEWATISHIENGRMREERLNTDIVPTGFLHRFFQVLFR